MTRMRYGTINRYTHGGTIEAVHTDVSESWAQDWMQSNSAGRDGFGNTAFFDFVAERWSRVYVDTCKTCGKEHCSC